MGRGGQRHEFPVLLQSIPGKDGHDGKSIRRPYDLAGLALLSFMLDS